MWASAGGRPQLTQHAQRRGTRGRSVCAGCVMNRAAGAGGDWRSTLLGNLTTIESELSFRGPDDSIMSVEGMAPVRYVPDPHNLPPPSPGAPLPSAWRPPTAASQTEYGHDYAPRANAMESRPMPHDPRSSEPHSRYPSAVAHEAPSTRASPPRSRAVYARQQRQPATERPVAMHQAYASPLYEGADAGGHFGRSHLRSVEPVSHLGRSALNMSADTLHPRSSSPATVAAAARPSHDPRGSGAYHGQPHHSHGFVAAEASRVSAPPMSDAKYDAITQKVAEVQRSVARSTSKVSAICVRSHSVRRSACMVRRHPRDLLCACVRAVVACFADSRTCTTHMYCPRPFLPRWHPCRTLWIW